MDFVIYIVQLKLMLVYCYSPTDDGSFRGDPPEGTAARLKTGICGAMLIAERHGDAWAISCCSREDITASFFSTDEPSRELLSPRIIASCFSLIIPGLSSEGPGCWTLCRSAMTVLKGLSAWCSCVRVPLVVGRGESVGPAIALWDLPELRYAE